MPSSVHGYATDISPLPAIVHRATSLQLSMYAVTFTRAVPNHEGAAEVSGVDAHISFIPNHIVSYHIISKFFWKQSLAESRAFPLPCLVSEPLIDDAEIHDDSVSQP